MHNMCNIEMTKSYMPPLKQKEFGGGGVGIFKKCRYLADVLRGRCNISISSSRNIEASR